MPCPLRRLVDKGIAWYLAWILKCDLKVDSGLDHRLLLQAVPNCESLCSNQIRILCEDFNSSDERVCA